MTLLVDDATWWWRGERWAHLVSTTSADELHRFANGLGVRRLAFQDDHYDLPAPMRDAAVAAGATAVSSRVLVAALRESELRRRGRRVPWREVDATDPEVRAVRRHVEATWPALADAWSSWLVRPAEVAVSATLPGHRPVEVPAAFAGAAWVVERAGGRIVDLLVPRG